MEAQPLHVLGYIDWPVKFFFCFGRKVTFFDIHSSKAKQFGFAMELGEGKRLCCCGDEPLNENNLDYARGCTWLLHEAFCLEADAESFKPFEKAHTTVKRAAATAREMGVENLVLYHSEDSTIENRKTLYTAEAKEEFDGQITVAVSGIPRKSPMPCT